MDKWLLAVLTTALIIFSGCTLRDDLINTLTGDETVQECEDTIIYGDWGFCDSSGIQPRINTITSCINGSIFQQVEIRNCVPSCQPEWVCGEWSNCRSSGFQTRECVDNNACNLIVNIPALSRACTFVNPCDEIVDVLKKAQCYSIVLNDYNKCVSMLTNEEDKTTCLFKHAEHYLTTAACNLINDSYNRNICKARAGLNREACNVLAPEYRDDCYPLVDYMYVTLASQKLNPTYCNYIEDEDIMDDCLADSNYNYYSTYKNNISDCTNLWYDSEATSLYQTVRACYVYHINKLEDASVCSTTPSWFRNDCNAIVNYNLSYCYDLSGTNRDWCLANMMYYYNNTNLCREASSSDDCFYTIGYWFREPDYCNYISSESKRNFCTTSYVNYCQGNFYNCYPEDYCDLIINDQTKKDTCVYNLIIDEMIYEGKVW
ncbi:MAG: hypothetical protein JW791_05230 [Nanoarchaeota archaeon]|nr:hypothetical protein [Nanoarchaeota archaeon]